MKFEWFTIKKNLLLLKILEFYKNVFLNKILIISLFIIELILLNFTIIFYFYLFLIMSFINYLFGFLEFFQ